MSKEKLREEIARLTDLYLRGGGLIEAIPSKKFLTPSCKWMAKYGWDYLPWVYIQDDSRLGYTYWLGGGNYLTKRQDLEE